MKDTLQIITALFLLIGTIYGVLKIENAIYNKIGDLAKTHHDRINAVEHNLELHTAIYDERKDQVDLYLNGLKEDIKHAKNRLLDDDKAIKIDIKELEYSLLEKIKELKAEINLLEEIKGLKAQLNQGRDCGE